MYGIEKKEDYLYLFDGYTHNIPVIYSSLEGQYGGELFADSTEHPQIAILFTPFAFHFVAGNADAAHAAGFLDDAVFKRYLPRTGSKEAIVFSPDSKWDAVLDEVFRKHGGLKDVRKLFHLNRERFSALYSGRKVPEAVETKILYEKNGGAERKYPICRIYKGETCVSFCSGFMLGKGHAEVDVATEEAYRGKGYAREAAFRLVNELLKSGIEPDWCTWPYRIESEKLALSLGFEPAGTVPAHIWVESECGALSQGSDRV